MIQFVVIGRDGTDKDALDRRMAVRPNHFETASKLKAGGNFVLGGAILDDKGMMTGSVMIVQFETEDELKQWLDNEPYVTGDVWREIEVKPFKVATVL